MTAFMCRPDIAYRIIDEHVFLITPDGRQHELVGDVEHCIWRRCEQELTSFRTLLNEIVEEFDVGEAEAQTDLTHFLNEMVAAGILSGKDK
jgi:hypothetical protein